MSKAKIKHQIEEKRGKDGELQFDVNEIQNEVVDLDGMEKILQEDANAFLLNNLLMSVQFFENYDRDVKNLREIWFKEFSLKSHHKKCFYADALLRLSGANVTFSPKHGPNKNSKFQLHPLRVYISSDNVQAAFDTSVLKRGKPDLWPLYQFTARTSEQLGKSGFISLVEFKTLQETDNGPKTKPQKNVTFREPLDPIEPNDIHSLDEQNTRLTRNDPSLGYQTTALAIPANGFYKYETPEDRLKCLGIHDWKMDSAPSTSHEIPMQCFQNEDVRQKLETRRTALGGRLRTQRLLNSAAFKGYFCDLLIERLCESLNLDINAVNESFVREEFIVVNQNGMEFCITPVVTIRDWAHFVPFGRFRDADKPEELLWPTRQMQKIMNVLPCNAVPTSQCDPFKENPDHEKIWKLVFPQAEEFLLLHMMHAHIRCYFFVLLIYKSFIETEINTASLGPKHLMHLLFWKVHRNFLAWPDDRPAETLLSFLKTLYKKLQNKSLCDFFISSRNLFASSHPKDLHKAQTLIKKIIENPVPYITRAVGQLTFERNIYPPFDSSKLHAALTASNGTEKTKKTIAKEKKTKKVHFQNDDEQLWTKERIKRIELERKAGHEEQDSKLSVESINLNEILTFNSANSIKCNQILQIFTSHFTQMGTVSLRNDVLPQGLLYLYQTQKLAQLMAAKGIGSADLRETREHISKLKQACCDKIKQELRKSPRKPKKQFPAVSGKLKPKTVIEEQEEETVSISETPKETAETTNSETCEVISVKL